MQKSKQVFSIGQQTKFQQLQLEISILEKQVVNALQEQFQPTNNQSSQIPIPLIGINDRMAKSGIRLSQETAY